MIIDAIYDKTTSENKLSYIRGDFNIDRLKDDVHRPIHDYLDLVYSLIDNYILICIIFFNVDQLFKEPPGLLKL